MIRRITVQDFMAHKETSLELAEGVTVITGPNNTGKSAVVEAIRSLVQSPPMRHAIRHGAPRATVRMELDTGEVIEWIRTEKNAVYQLKRSSGGEPEVYAKFGRVVPEDIRKLIRMDLVETESGSVDIHIGNQRYPIFLLDQAGSQAASFFAASTEAAYLLKMQQALKRRTDRAKSRRREVLEKMERLNKQLSAYSLLDATEGVLRQAERLHGVLSEQARTLPGLEESLGHLSVVLGRFSGTSVHLEVLEKAQSPPVLEEVTLLARSVEQLKGVQVELSTMERTDAGLSVLQFPPHPAEAAALDRLAGELSAHQCANDVLGQKLESLGQLRAVPPREETVELHRLVERLSSSASVLHSAREHLDVLRRAELPPSLLETNELSACLRTRELQDRQFRFEGERLAVMGLLRHVPGLLDVTGLQHLMESFETVLRTRQRSELASQITENVQEPPLPHAAWEMEALSLQMGALEKSLENMAFRDKCCSHLAQPPVLDETTPLSSLLASLAHLTQAASAGGDQLHVLDALAPLPGAAPLDGLEALIPRLAELERDVAAKDTAEGTLEKALEQSRLELKRLLDRLGSCPTCGQALDMDHFLEGAHA